MWNPFKKKGEVIDFTKLEKRGIVKKTREIEQDSGSDILDLTSTANLNSSTGNDNSDAAGLGFLGSLAGAGSNADANPISSVSSNSGGDDLQFKSYASSSEKKRRLTKRLMDMTSKLEQLDKEFYQLQQRIELIERKLERIDRGY